MQANLLSWDKAYGPKNQFRGALLEFLKSKMEKIKLGNGFDEGTEMGPVISKEHLLRLSPI